MVHWIWREKIKVMNNFNCKSFAVAQSINPKETHLNMFSVDPAEHREDNAHEVDTII